MTIDEVRRRLAGPFPELADAPLRRLGEGTDHVAWMLDERLLVRTAKRGIDERSARREAALLEEVSRISPIPVPRVVFAGEGIAVSPYLAGVALLDRAAPPSGAAVVQLGAFLTAIHGAPTSAFEGLVETDTTTLAEWREEASSHWGEIKGSLPRAFAASLAAFFDAKLPVEGDARVLCHADLGAEHLLVDSEERLVGVIDWSDACFADPALDFARPMRDFGLDWVTRMNAYYTPARGAPVDWDRVVFYARCVALEDMAYGLAIGDPRYGAAARAAMDRLFP